jgi:hypothetical protein
LQHAARRNLRDSALRDSLTFADTLAASFQLSLPDPLCARRQAERVQAYSGAVFCTPDGDWPAAQHLPRVTAALKTCGIELWELYQVDNSCCAGAPLGLLDA